MEIAKKKRKRETFIVPRMWFHELLSNFYPDRDFISDAQGNNIYIGNNIVITKNSKTALILVTDLGVKAPRFFTAHLINKLKSKYNDVRVDFVFKNQDYEPDTRSGLESRVKNWEDTLANEKAHKIRKQRAERLLYTSALLDEGVKLFKTRMYILLRVGNDDRVKDVVATARQYLKQIGVENRQIKSKIEIHLKYISLLSCVDPKELKDIPWLITTADVLADLTPNTQGTNDLTGTIFGTDILNMQPYIINLRALASGKGIGVFAPAGEGKTFMVQNLMQEGIVTGFRESIYDIKGNEFTGHTESCGGVIIKLGSRSKDYVNVFRWDATVEEDADTYTNKMLSMATLMMVTLSKAPPRVEDKVSTLVNTFLNDMYNSLGVSRSNKNTWRRTDYLTPQVVYDKFTTYIRSSYMQDYYGELLQTVHSNLGSYWSRLGNNRHCFSRPINLTEVINTNVLTFAFDILDDSSFQDEALFKVKMLFARIINDEYLLYNKRHGYWTIIVEEESSFAADFVLEEYKKNFLLRRAQNVINVLVGNSIRALADNPIAQSILDNLQLLLVGNVNDSSKQYLIQEYNLGKQIQDRLLAIDNKRIYDSVFVTVNKIQKQPVNGLIKVFVPERVLSNKVFKGVDVIE